MTHMLRTIRYGIALLLLAIAAPFAWLADRISPRPPKVGTVPPQLVTRRRRVPRHVRRQAARVAFKMMSRQQY